MSYCYHYKGCVISSDSLVQHFFLRYVQISEKGNYGNFRYLQKHLESKKSIFENFERHRNFWKFPKFRKLEITGFGNFGNYRIFRTSRDFWGITSKISKISVISFLGNLNTADLYRFSGTDPKSVFWVANLSEDSMSNNCDGRKCMFN